MAPVVVVYCPAAQLPQATPIPEADENRPAAQPTQLVEAAAPIVVRYSPAPQLVQVDATAAPVVAEYWPAAQLVHAELPDVVTNWPAGQLLQLDCPEPA